MDRGFRAPVEKPFGRGRGTLARGATMLAAAALFGAGCASSPWERVLTFSRDGIALYEESISATSDHPQPNYLHPILIEPGLLEEILAQLVYERGGLFRGPERRSVLTPEEAHRLAEPLALALRSVPPTRRVRFLATRSRWTDVFVGLRGTSGVIFSSQEGKLAMAFDYVDEGLLGGASGRPDEVVFRVDPTSARKGTRLIPFPGSSVHVDEGGNARPHWLEIDLAAFASLLASRPSQPGVATPKPQAAAEETLETLERLRAQGVLSEEEYRAARDRALSSEKAAPEAPEETP